MQRFTRTRALFAATIGIFAAANLAFGQVVINEVVYDDGSTDDREFVELFNPTANPVTIGGWTLGGRDPTAANATVTITAGTVLAPGGYYVIGNTGVLNVNQVVAANAFENDNETLELSNGATLVDALAYEINKGAAFAAPVAGQIGPGYWGNTQASDIAGTPLNATGGLARWVDGRDTDNNGRNFGFRPSTPGTTNNPTNITAYIAPDVTGGTVGSVVPGFAFSFVAPKVVDPTVVDAAVPPINPNVIPPSPAGNRAIIAWDPSGGGNGVAAAETFNTTASSFNILAYLDTRDLPLMSNTAGASFRGSEFTFYGIGSGDALANPTNLSGFTGFTTVRDAGITGVHWVYEKVGETGAALGDVSEKLYLVDANDGGDQNAGDWTILATLDLAARSSAWFNLGISIDASGNGVATFDTTTVNFTTSTALNGASFAVGYRENTQIGADGTPDAILRPATFSAVPEPATAGVLALGACMLGLRRRK